MGAIVFVALFALDKVITAGLKKNTSNVFVDWNRIFNGEIDADLVINGSSIAELQISPKILDSILDVQSYNFGMSGFSFLMQKARYDVFSKNNDEPKIIVQIVGDGTLKKKEGLFRLPQFLPYLNDSIIRSTTKKYKGLSYLDYHMPLVRYSGESETVIKGVASFLHYEPLSTKKFKGYASNDIPWDNNFEEFVKDHPNGMEMHVSNYIKNLFEDFIKKEKQRGSKVFIIFPPTYYELENYILNRKELLDFYTSISKKYKVPFLDYSKSDFTKRKELFYNATHLNKKGAELFSTKLAADIKRILENYHYDF